MNAHFSMHMAIALLMASLTAYAVTYNKATSRSDQLSTLWRLDTIFVLWALLPFILMKAGVPSATFNSPAMNLFLFFPLIRKSVEGGMLIGHGLTLGVLGLQYALLLFALRAAGRREHLAKEADSRGDRAPTS